MSTVASPLLVTDFYKDFYDKTYSAEMVRMKDFRLKIQKEKYPEQIGMQMVWRGLANSIPLNRLKSTFGEKVTDDVAAALGFMVSGEDEDLSGVKSDVEFYFHKKNSLDNLNIEALRGAVEKAARGSNEAVESIEYTYLCNVLGHMTMRLFMANGLLGKNMQNASGHVYTLFVSDATFEAPVNASQHFSMVGANYLDHHYKPLPPLW